MVDEVYYQRCSNCLSIFAFIKNEITDKYKSYQPLIDFRMSEEFQTSAAQRRAGIWNDLLFWLEFRLARYLAKSSGLDVIDIDNHYNEFAKRIKNAGFCGSYNEAKTADVVLFFDKFRRLAEPVKTLSQLRCQLKDNGLLVMNLRVGSGFDVLTLKGCRDILTPYEVICLPSIEGLEIILDKAGFEILETSSTGTLDVRYVQQNMELVDESNLFARYLINKTDKSSLADFQRFLQKSGMSSHARVIARKRPV